MSSMSDLHASSFSEIDHLRMIDVEAERDHAEFCLLQAVSDVYAKFERRDANRLVLQAVKEARR